MISDGLTSLGGEVSPDGLEFYGWEPLAWNDDFTVPYGDPVSENIPTSNDLDRDGDGKFEKTLSDEKLEGIQQAERVISRLPVSDEIKTKILSKLEKAKNSASKSSKANEKSGAQIERDLEGKLKADANNKPKDKLKPGSSAKLIDKQKPNNDKGKPKKR